ncbi:MAG: DUF4347 domain-containing protein [Desulfomonile tiedjei]|nr:DUF4347 domain-containing protein [Desulfomonile tiedjei]
MKSRFWNKPAVNGRKMIFEALEERIVLDAAVDHALHGHSFSEHPTSFGSAEDPRAFYGISSALVGEGWNHKPVHQASVGHDPVPVASAPHVAAKPAPSAAFHAPADAAHAAPAPSPALHTATHAAAHVEHLASSAAHKADPSSHSGLDVVLIQDSLEGKDAIAAAASPDTKVVFYSAEKDSLDSINAKLGELVSAAGKKIEHLAIAGHGEKDTLIMGSQQIDLSNASEHRSEFKALAKNLAPHAQVQFYNCSVAADALGEALVDRVAVMTGAQVFASSDATGAKPGNWTLEYASDPKAQLASVLDAIKLEKVPGHLQQIAVTALGPEDPGINSFKIGPDGQPLLPVIGGQAYFAATDPNIRAGAEIYASSNVATVAATGVGAGQTVLTNFTPSDPQIVELTPMGGNVYAGAVNPDQFTPTDVGQQLYQVTPAGVTTQVSNFNDDMDTVGTPFARPSAHIQQITANSTNTAVYFVGEEENGLTTQTVYPDALGFEVWRTNGGPATPTVLTPIVTDDGSLGADAGNVTAFNAANFFVVYNPNIRELTAAGDTSMYLIGHSPFTLDTADTTAYSNIQGTQVWRTLGTHPAVAPGGPITDNLGNQGAVSAFGHWGFNGAAVVHYPAYDADIAEVTPVPGRSDVFFTANEPHSWLGYEIWRSDGTAPNFLGDAVNHFERTHNPTPPPAGVIGAVGDFGNITNFGLGTDTDPNIHDLTFVQTGAGAVGGRLYFVADDGTGPSIWGSDGANVGVSTNAVTDRLANAEVPAVLSATHPDISQLIGYNGNLFFVGNQGSTAGHPGQDDYQIFRVTPGVGGAADTVAAITNFPETALAGSYSAHPDAHIKLVAGIDQGASRFLYFEADSIDGKSRELFRVDATRVAAGPADPITMEQVTNFGIADPDFKLIAGAGGVPAFVAHDSQEIFTVADGRPTTTIPDLTAVLEDNNNLNTPIPLPNALRIGDPDSNNILQVDVTAQSGFSTQGANLALNLTNPHPGIITVTNLNPGTDTQWRIAGTIADWQQEPFINDVLATLTATPNVDTNANTVIDAATSHRIDVTVTELTNGTLTRIGHLTDFPVPAGADPNIDPGQAIANLTVAPINDPPTFNSLVGDPTFPGLQVVSSTGHLLFNAGNANQILVRDVDVNETIAPGNTVQVTLNAGEGNLRLSGTAGLTFQQGTPGAQNAIQQFTGNLVDVDNALNNMIFTPAPYAVGGTGVSIMVSDLGHTGVTAVQPSQPNQLVQPNPNYMAFATVPVNIDFPVGGFFGRLYDQP